MYYPVGHMIRTRNYDKELSTRFRLVLPKAVGVRYQGQGKRIHVISYSSNRL